MTKPQPRHPFESACKIYCSIVNNDEEQNLCDEAGTLGECVECRRIVAQIIRAYTEEMLT